ncbi:MAG: tetratricopeptide repeat protein [Planctomycetota bacterium]
MHVFPPPIRRRSKAPRSHRRGRRYWAAWLAGLLLTPLAAPASAHPWAQGDPELPDPGREAYPESPAPGLPELEVESQQSKLIARLIDDPLITPDERLQLRIEHGSWRGLDPANLSPRNAARLALLRWELDHPALRHPDAPSLWRAQAARRRGQPALSISIVQEIETDAARLERAKAYLDLGQSAAAVTELEGMRDRAQWGGPAADADELVAQAEAVLLLHDLEGAAGLNNHRLATGLLERVRNEIDPIHPGARALESRIFFGKADPKAGQEAAQEALALNPGHGHALATLGLEAVRRFDFATASNITNQLRSVNPTHPLANRVLAASLLKQKDPQAALAVIDAGLGQRPTDRPLLRLRAQAAALAYDDAMLRRTESNYRALAGRDPRLDAELASLYSDARQYTQAIERADAALALRPGWSIPLRLRAEVLMQDGRIADAVPTLRAAQAADPTHRDIANYLALAEQMARWPTIETDHFVVRHSPSDAAGNPHPDAAWARDMARRLDAYHDEFAELYQHEPSRKTQIDVMPNDDAFAVRIMGLPQVFTVGACTGDVIVFTAPRAGAERQFEFYDWPLVFRHEYAHVVTLGKTGNRIPHWFTEGLAVAQETTGRTYDRQRLLADALANGALMPINELSWGFIRPKTPGQRGLAYAQANWVIEYLQHRYGPDTPIRMMELQAAGATDTQALEAATGDTHDDVMAGFLDWAQDQTASWGLGPTGIEADDAEALSTVLQGLLGQRADPNAVEDEDDAGASSVAERLTELAERLPDHPGVRLALARRAVDRALDHDSHENEIDHADRLQTAMAAVERYQAARPADPWSYRARARLARHAGDPAAEAEALRHLDRVESSSAYAARLSDIEADRNRHDLALAWVLRALDREPYNASFRERAARFALLSRNTDEAVHQLTGLSLLEPQTAEHHVRLAYLYDRLGRADDARQAAEQAKALNPAAPVDRFLIQDDAVQPAPAATP